MPLGFQNQTQDAIVATNYVGIGLPEYLFWQFIQAVGQSNYQVGTSQLYCPVKSTDYNYYCYFTSTCANVAGTSFWNNWVIKFKFAGTDQYITIPMADLAYGAGSNCYIAVSRLDMDVLTNSDQVILGASFL